MESKNQITFSTTKQRTVTDVIPFTMSQFIEALNKYKPSEIFNQVYSSKVPCWTITEYLGKNRVKYFAASWADKTPVEELMDIVYTSWLIQGLSSCFITVETPIQSPDADNTERGEFDPNDPQTKEWIEYFTIKANYLSENVGSGELWNRTEFRNKIIDVLTDVADKVQSESIPDTSKDLAKELFEKVRHALVDLNNEHFAQRFCEQYIYAAANPTPPTLLNELRELSATLNAIDATKPYDWKGTFVESLADLDAIIQKHEKK